MVKRRNLLAAAGTGLTAAIAGCTGGDGSSGGSATDAGGDGGTAETTQSGVETGERPLQILGPAWGLREGKRERFEEVTGIDTEFTVKAQAAANRQVLSGGNEVFDALFTGGQLAPQIIGNDMASPIDPESIENWNEDNVTEYILNGTEVYDGQFDRHAEVIWNDVESQDEIQFYPNVFNADSVGFNPRQVPSDVDEWSAIFDDQYEGKSMFNQLSTVSYVVAMMHLADRGMVDASLHEISDPTREHIDAMVDFLVKQKQAGQFKALFSDLGTQINFFSSEEAIIGNIWGPAVLGTRENGTPAGYAKLARQENQQSLQGYDAWMGGTIPLKPGVSDRNNEDEVAKFLDLHLTAWYAGFVGQSGYIVPQYPNKELVRGEPGMPTEFYDWFYEGTATSKPVDGQFMFTPGNYEWTDGEYESSPDGHKRFRGGVEDFLPAVGAWHVAPNENDYLVEQWQEFTGA
jgi:spermidine/putrescine-binding protein